MFGSQALETVTGLVFFFLAISIFVTSVQEFLTTFFELRTRTLKEGLQELIAQGEELGALSQSIWNHPEVNPSRNKAYVTAAGFTAALVDVLWSNKVADPLKNINSNIAQLDSGPLKDAVTSAIASAQNDLNAFKARMGTWFDSSMIGLSSQYKRRSGYISLVLGAVLAFGLNLDAIGVVRALWTSEALREQAAAAAAAEVAKGMHASSFKPTDITLQMFDFHLNFNVNDPAWTFSVVAFLGCAITAFAVSLGAPFWFDTLQNVMNLRGATKPAESQPAQPASPGAVQQANPAPAQPANGGAGG